MDPALLSCLPPGTLQAALNLPLITCVTDPLTMATHRQQQHQHHQQQFNQSHLLYGSGGAHKMTSLYIQGSPVQNMMLKMDRGGGGGGGGVSTGIDRHDVASLGSSNRSPGSSIHSVSSPSGENNSPSLPLALSDNIFKNVNLTVPTSTPTTVGVGVRPGYVGYPSFINNYVSAAQTMPSNTLPSYSLPSNTLPTQSMPTQSMSTWTPAVSGTTNYIALPGYTAAPGVYNSSSVTDGGVSGQYRLNPSNNGSPISSVMSDLGQTVTGRYQPFVDVTKSPPALPEVSCQPGTVPNRNEVSQVSKPLPQPVLPPVSQSVSSSVPASVFQSIFTSGSYSLPTSIPKPVPPFSTQQSTPPPTSVYSVHIDTKYPSQDRISLTTTNTSKITDTTPYLQRPTLEMNPLDKKAIQCKPVESDSILRITFLKVVCRQALSNDELAQINAIADKLSEQELLPLIKYGLENVDADYFRRIISAVNNGALPASGGVTGTAGVGCTETTPLAFDIDGLDGTGPVTNRVGQSKQGSGKQNGEPTEEVYLIPPPQRLKEKKSTTLDEQHSPVYLTPPVVSTDIKRNYFDSTDGSPELSDTRLYNIDQTLASRRREDVDPKSHLYPGDRDETNRRRVNSKRGSSHSSSGYSGRSYGRSTSSQGKQRSESRSPPYVKRHQIERSVKSQSRSPKSPRSKRDRSGRDNRLQKHKSDNNRDASHRERRTDRQQRSPLCSQSSPHKSRSNRHRSPSRSSLKGSSTRRQDSSENWKQQRDMSARDRDGDYHRKRDDVRRRRASDRRDSDNGSRGSRRETVTKTSRDSRCVVLKSRDKDEVSRESRDVAANVVDCLNDRDNHVATSTKRSLNESDITAPHGDYVTTEPEVVIVNDAVTNKTRPTGRWSDVLVHFLGQMHSVGTDKLALLMSGDCTNPEALFGMFDADVRQALPSTPEEQEEFLTELAGFVYSIGQATESGFDNGSRGLNKRSAHFDDGSTQAKRRYSDGLQDFDARMQSDAHMLAMGGVQFNNGMQQQQQFQRMRASQHIKDLEIRDVRERSCLVCVRELVVPFEQHCMTKEHQHKARLVKKGCILCKTGSFANYEFYKAHIDLDSHKKAKDELNRSKTEGPDNQSTEEQKDTKKSSAQPSKGKQAKVESDGTEVNDGLSDEAEVTLHDDLVYDPDVVVGQEHVIAVKGFFCKLCHKFYQSEDLAKKSHCKSERHFEKYQEFVISKQQDNDVIDNEHSSPEKNRNSNSTTGSVKVKTEPGC